jgi:hypothetical protein
MSGEEYQPAAPYPPNFILAVQPGDVDVSLCEHESDDPVCFCVHDWRINWGNVSREPKPKATYI